MILKPFLYDFITEQIEEGNETYARDLLECFGEFFTDNKWFKLLKLRLTSYVNGQTTQKLIEQILEEHLNERDLEFNLELLDILAAIKNDSNFLRLLPVTFTLLQTEENFQDLLSILINHFELCDQKSRVKELETIFEGRRHSSLEQPLDAQDPDLRKVKTFFN